MKNNTQTPIAMKYCKYIRTEYAEMSPVHKDDTVLTLECAGVSVSKRDIANGSPKEGDMIARNPDNHDVRWLVAKDYFEANFAPKQVESLGNEDPFLLISKIVAPNCSWTKSTKAMPIYGGGVLVQVAYRQGNSAVSEALQYIPNTCIFEEKEGEVISRSVGVPSKGVVPGTIVKRPVKPGNA
jgi:hypothetical protein